MSPAADDHARTVLNTPGAPAEALYGAAVELRGAFERAEHTIGLLAPDAVDVMIGCFAAAAQQGLVAATLDLAELYERGGISPWARFPARNPAAAIALYRQADAAGSTAGAVGWVRTAYFARDAAQASAAAARLSALHAASPEDAGILLLLGYFLQQGYGYASDPASSVRFFDAAAARGDADAAFELSVAHATGTGTPVDAAESARWTVRAAELGSGRAQANLGGMHATGNGVEKDAATAVQWYLRAAESGEARGAYIAGVMLLTGDEGLPADPAQAAAMLRTADDLGYPDVDGALAALGLRRPA